MSRSEASSAPVAPEDEEKARRTREAFMSGIGEGLLILGSATLFMGGILAALFFSVR